MVFERLRHFDAVARTLHFGKAANALGIDQSILSRSIKRLEQDVGVQLLNRSRRHVALTPAGQLFLDEARKAIDAAERAARVARLAASGEVDEVKVAIFELGVLPFAARAIVRFRAANPAVSVKLVDYPSSEHMERLADGDVDLVLTLRSRNNRQNLQGYAVQMLRRYNFVAAVPASWPIAKFEEASLADLAPYPFILLHSGRTTSELVAATLAACRDVGFIPRVVQESWQLATSLGLVAEGQGIALVQEASAYLGFPGVRFLKVLDLPEVLQIDALAIADPRRQSPPLVEFLSHLQSAAEAELAGARVGEEQAPWQGEAAETRAAG